MVQTGRHGQRAVGNHTASQTSPVETHRRTQFRLLLGESYLERYSVRLQRIRTHCIIEKAIVFIAVSYFEHIFIIIYSYIPLCTILYIPFTYFYNYILFSCFEYFVYFYHKIETSLFVFIIYSFSKILVAIKI